MVPCHNPLDLLFSIQSADPDLVAESGPIGLDQNSGGLDIGIFPDDDRAITFFRAEREIDRAADHRVIPCQETDIFATKCTSAVASHGGSLFRQAGEGIGK